MGEGTRRSRDIYIAIMVAEAQGKGLHLSFEELQDLTLDDAIATRAHNGLSTTEWELATKEGWARIDPYKVRDAANEAIRSEEERRE